MNHLDVTMYFPESRLTALQKYLDDEGATVSEKLAEHFTHLYEQYVPEEERFKIEADIEQEDAREKAESEARKRFGVFHIRDGGTDSYFKSELFQTFLSAAYRYRLYDRNELSSQPEIFHDAFGEKIPITADEFNTYREDINADPRVLGVFDFNLDEGIASACQSKDNEWSAYNLYHVSTAAYQAQRSSYRASDKRIEIFDNYLDGKEIEIPDDSEAPVMQM